VPDGRFQKLTLNLCIAADSLAAKPITIRSTASVVAKVLHLMASAHLMGGLAVVGVIAGQASRKEDMLKSMGDASTKLREKLGESLSSMSGDWRTRWRFGAL
jgi:hypothetical protein